MIPDSVPAGLHSLRDTSSVVPVIVGAGLGFGSAVFYLLLKVGYGSAYLDAGTYNFWQGILVWGSIVAGIGVSMALGYAGVSSRIGVLIGVAPVVGLIAGSAITVVGGLGSYDSSPVVLAIGFLLGSGVLCGTGWLIGRAVRWQIH